MQPSSVISRVESIGEVFRLSSSTRLLSLASRQVCDELRAHSRILLHRSKQKAMTVIDRVTSPAGRSSITKLSLAGAICYALWGFLHLQAAYAVYHVGAALEPGMAQGRVFQDAWNLLFFGVTAIVVALTLNIRNNAWGYWINLGVLTLADTGLIFFILLPGYMPLWPGVAGPVLWVLGWIFTTLAYFRRLPPQRPSRP